MLPKSTTPKSTTAPMAIQSVVCPSSGAGPPCDVPPCDILPCDILPCEGPRDALSCAACSFDGRGEASPSALELRVAGSDWLLCRGAAPRPGSDGALG
ncbi:MAG TPA: hypothetical protein RMI62_08295, partial [Polyangiaceae bacterium LLY-WYZ-15_(1-7)]|nr:hypothetical protein [Polyangiaceae bacterium LLY-WYZ-15_(1-7)]